MKIGPQPGQRLRVTCVDLDDDGAGIAREPMTVHVAGALPGERVAVTVAHLSSHRPEAWARLEAIDAPSAERRPPACAAFGACGGCVLQHLDYAAQRAWKRARVARALSAYPALTTIDVRATVASPRTLGYRNRSKLVAARASGGGVILGAYAPRSHDVVDVAGCRIAEPPLDDTTAALRVLFGQAGVAPYDERTLTGDVRHVVLQTNRDGAVLATWVTRRPLADGPSLARAFRRDRPEVVGVVEHTNAERGNAIFDAGGDSRVLDGAPAIEDTIEVAGRSIRLRLSAGAFFQANRDVAALAYADILAALAPRPTDRLVDVYSGVGGIALLLASAAAEVIGIESHPGAVADAAASAAMNGVTNARFVAGDAARALASVDSADSIVVNPPRKGCAPDVLDSIARLTPRAVAYLSCDPDTLARDLAVLAERGFRIESVIPFDMLPHTPHIETLAILRKRQIA
jgi:23S rRNA (uracil1939-C5)-methyltransferase